MYCFSCNNASKHGRKVFDAKKFCNSLVGEKIINISNKEISERIVFWERLMKAYISQL